MTKPDDVSQESWDAALSAVGQMDSDWSHDGATNGLRERKESVEIVARAIMAAKEEEREECARQVETGQGWITDYLIEGKSFSPLIAAAIRNRKLANNTNKD